MKKTKEVCGHCGERDGFFLCRRCGARVCVECVNKEGCDCPSYGEKDD